MKRLRIEVLRFLAAHDLLLGIGAAAQSWHEAALSTELWVELLLSDFGVSSRGDPQPLYRAKWEGRKRVGQIRTTDVKIFSTSTGSDAGEVDLQKMMYEVSSLPGVCYLKSGEMFVSGGKDDRTCYHLVQLFNLTLCTQERLPDMLFVRYAHGVIHVGDSVYCFGGGDDPLFGRAENTAESYSLTTKSWTQLPEMLNHRMMFSPAKHRKRVYLIGGCWTHKCEVFDVAASSYSPLSFMSPLKGPNCCVKVAGAVLIFGTDEVWKWTTQSSDGPTLLCSTSNYELDLPYFYLCGVRFRDSVFLHGDDQRLLLFSLRTHTMLETGKAPTPLQYEDDADLTP